MTDRLDGFNSLTVTQAAAAMGVTRAAVLLAIRRGSLAATKEPAETASGFQYRIARSEIERYQSHIRHDLQRVIRWTPEIQAQARAWLAADVPIPEIAARLGCSERAVRAARYRHKLDQPAGDAP